MLCHRKNRLDFAVKYEKRYLFWAEAKKGDVSKWMMLAQLFLTIKPRIDEGEIPPPLLGCFNEKEITFVETYHAYDIFKTNDFNWSEKASNVSLKTASRVEKLLGGKEYTFDWHQDKEGIKNS